MVLRVLNDRDVVTDRCPCGKMMHYTLIYDDETRTGGRLIVRHGDGEARWETRVEGEAWMGIESGALIAWIVRVHEYEGIDRWPATSMN